jgi:hypothetical protein
MIAPIPVPQTPAVAQRNRVVLLVVVLRQTAALHQATAPGVDLLPQPLPKLGRLLRLKEQWKQPTHRSHSTH